MRALVLSGGAVRGAYQAGVIKYLIGERKINYDIICGSSVGAINAAALGMFSCGQEVEAANFLVEMWSSITQKNIYKRWQPFGRFHALWKTGIFDSSPLRKLITNTIDLEKIKKSNKTVCIGAVSLGSGKYKVFDQNNPHFIEAIMASTAVPGIFEAVEIDGEIWVDGGIRELVPVRRAIDVGALSVDIVATSPEGATHKIKNLPTIGNILVRSLDLMIDKIISNDIDKVIMYNKLALLNGGYFTDKKAVKMNVIRPNYVLIDNLLDFSHDKIINMIDIGYEDAKMQFSMQ